MPGIGATTGSPGTGGATTGTGAAANPTSGAGGTTSSSGGAAGAGPSPMFSWPEANPDGGAAMLCKPGHYTGMYDCDVNWAPFVMNLHLNGPVDLQLNQSQNGEFLTVSGGSLKSAAGVYSLDAKIEGQLDCQTGAFTANLVNGGISIPPFPPGGTFSGAMMGSYDPSAMQMNGKWNLLGIDTFMGATCDGPWQITYQGP